MKRNRILFLILCMFMFFSCSLEAESVPYIISGEMVIDSDLYDEDATFVFSLYNKSEKTITSFTIIFYLFDEDGNSPMSGRSNVVNKITVDIEPEEKLESSFSLMKYLAVFPDEPYSVDYLYLSQITYSDETVWSDPFGIHYF